MPQVIDVEGMKLKFEDLFKAPEKDGTVISVRVHRSVKEALLKLAEKEGLHGVSELVRYIIAGFLMGKYKIVKPDPKVLAPPIYLNINVVKATRSSDGDSEDGVEDALEALEAKAEIEEVIKEAEDFIMKAKMRAVKLQGNEYARKLRTRIFKALVKAVRYNFRDRTEKLKQLFEELNNLLVNKIT
ncbi:MAG: CopG family transcriptional regulator [Crenarchaeota archaeon]|nr:CopG family transcriptional regulator [Thermoproteota archaeon]